jgi:hypothetical protein
MTMVDIVSGTITRQAIRRRACGNVPDLAGGPSMPTTTEAIHSAGRRPPIRS